MGVVKVFAIKRHLGFSTIPASRVEEARALFAPTRDQLLPHATVLITELNDLNLLVHPIVTMLNTGAIDRGAVFLCVYPPTNTLLRTRTACLLYGACRFHQNQNQLDTNFA
jgi:hypothetical protein